MRQVGDARVQPPAHRSAGQRGSANTAEGRVRAMGTRFAVRQENGRTRVVVEAHVVEVRPRLAQARAVRVEAGRGLSFDVLASGPLLPAPADAGALTLDDGEAVLDILEAPLPVRDEVGKASGLIPRPSRKILSSG